MNSNSEKSLSGDKLKDARSQPTLSGKAVLPSVPTTNVKPIIDEETRLAKLTDKQLLGEARKMLARKPGPGQPELRKIDAAELICMIVMQFRAPLPGLDPYCLEKGAPKTYTMFREKEARKK